MDRLAYFHGIESHQITPRFFQFYSRRRTIPIPISHGASVLMAARPSKRFFASNLRSKCSRRFFFVRRAIPCVTARMCHFSSSIKQRSKFKRHKHSRVPAAAVGPRERQPARAGGATPRARAAEGAVGGARGRRTGRGVARCPPPSRPSARGRARGRPALGLRRCTTAAAGSEQPGCEKIVRAHEESNNNNNNNKQQQTTTITTAAACRGGRSRRWRPAPRRPPRPTAHALLPPPLRPRTTRTRIRSLRATTPQRATTTATGRRCRAPRRSARG